MSVTRKYLISLVRPKINLSPIFFFMWLFMDVNTCVVRRVESYNFFFFSIRLFSSDWISPADNSVTFFLPYFLLPHQQTKLQAKKNGLQLECISIRVKFIDSHERFNVKMIERSCMYGVKRWKESYLATKQNHHLFAHLEFGIYSFVLLLFVVQESQ